MRKISLNDIQTKLANKQREIDFAVNVFRGKTKEQGWLMKRTRPRDPDEIKALNYLARSKYLKGVRDGSIHYDKEKRVLRIAEYLRS